MSALLLGFAGRAVRSRDQRAVVEEECGVQLRWVGGWVGAERVAWLAAASVLLPQMLELARPATPPAAGIFQLNNHSDWRVWRNSLPGNAARWPSRLGASAVLALQPRCLLVLAPSCTTYACPAWLKPPAAAQRLPAYLPACLPALSDADNQLGGYM